MRRAAVLGGLILFLALATTPATVRGADTPSSVTVSMKAFAFSPASVAVAQGGTVTWTYDETATDVGCESPVFQTPLPVNCPGHSTTAVDKGVGTNPLWDSGVHRADGFPFKVTFTKPGTYHYICTVHGGPNANNPVTVMEGDVVVFAAEPAAPSPAAAAPQVQAGATLAATGAGPGGAVWGIWGLMTALGVLALRRTVGRLAA